MVGTRSRQLLLLAMFGGLLVACWHAAPVHQAPPPTAPAELEAPPPPANATYSTTHVLDRILSTYMRPMRHCYQDYMKKYGETRGKIVLSFTVDRTGHLADARADGMTRQITSCVERKMSTWYFTRPPADGDEETRFRVPVQLVPR